MPPRSVFTHALATPVTSPVHAARAVSAFAALPSPSRTGKEMPKNVPVDADGLEDADAFFRSDSMGPSSNFNTPQVRRGPGAPNTSSSGRPSTIRARQRHSGRLSQLARDDDDMEIEPEPLHSDDDPNTTPPQPFHLSSPNPPPSVPIPHRSQIPPPSPLDFDGIPTPRSRGPVANARAGGSRMLPPANFDDEMESPTNRRKIKGKQAQKARDSFDEPDADDSAELQTRQSDEEEDEDTQPVRRAGAKRHTGPIRDDDSDTVVEGTYEEDTYVSDNNMEPAGYEQDEDVEEDEDVSLEAEAIAREDDEPSSDESEEEAPPPPKRNGRRVKQSLDEDPDTTPRQQGPRRQRVSQIPAVASAYEGDFRTRKGRNHFRPLKYWMGERYEYRRGTDAPEVERVIHMPTPETPALGAKKRARPVKKPALPRMPLTPQSEEDPEAGIDDNVNQEAVVVVFPTQREVKRRVVLPRSQLKPKPVVGNDFKYQKVFGDGKFIASGVVHIPVGKSKPAKPSKDNAYVFYVIDGTVNVTLHTTSFLCGTGAQFIIPRGNIYCIENRSPTKEAKLFFAQARMIRFGEDSDVTDEEGEAVPAADAEPATVQKPRRAAPAEEEEDDEDDDAEEETPAPPPKKKRGRPRKSG